MVHPFLILLLLLLLFITFNHIIADVRFYAAEPLVLFAASTIRNAFLFKVKAYSSASALSYYVIRYSYLLLGSRFIKLNWLQLKLILLFAHTFIFAYVLVAPLICNSTSYYPAAFVHSYLFVYLPQLVADPLPCFSSFLQLCVCSVFPFFALLVCRVSVCVNICSLRIFPQLTLFRLSYFTFNSLLHPFIHSYGSSALIISYPSI